MEKKVEHKNYIIQRDSIQNYPLDEITAAVAYHECYNLSKLERWLVMEAFINRIENNFNNNGKTVEKQLLAKKQFTGLWKYSPQQFKYDSNDSICVQNLAMAKLIISGSRMCTNRHIYYWAGKDDGSHRRWVGKNRLSLSNNIKHWFR